MNRSALELPAFEKHLCMRCMPSSILIFMTSSSRPVTDPLYISVCLPTFHSSVIFSAAASQSSSTGSVSTFFFGSFFKAMNLRGAAGGSAALGPAAEANLFAWRALERLTTELQPLGFLLGSTSRRRTLRDESTLQRNTAFARP